MRVVNQKFETITEYDLSKGELLEVTTLKEDALPVDNVTKFAPDDEDWEQALMYVPYSETNEDDGAEVIPTQEDTAAMLVDHEYRLMLLELGITE